MLGKKIGAVLCRRVGAAAIPSMMISLGGALAKGPGDSKVSARAVFALVAIRLVILPSVGGFAIISGAAFLTILQTSKRFQFLKLKQYALAFSDA